jgi:hypothetical protein
VLFDHRNDEKSEKKMGLFSFFLPLKQKSGFLEIPYIYPEFLG